MLPDATLPHNSAARAAQIPNINRDDDTCKLAGGTTMAFHDCVSRKLSQKRK